MSDLLGDIRYALRAFRRSPLHTLLTILILGVGIGAVTVMFSTMNTAVLRPLPYPEPERLVWGWKASEQVQRNSLSWDDYRDYRDGVGAFQELAAFYVFRPQILATGLEESERVRGSLVTPNFFRTLETPPALGRPFLPEEAVLGGAPVVILSHSYWQGRMGGDPDVLGRVLTLDGTATEIVGVMPEGFQFRGEDTHLWLPVQEGAGYTQGRMNNNFFFVGRLQEGADLSLAQAQIDAVGRNIQAQDPGYANWWHFIEPLHEVFYGDLRDTLFILFGLVTLVPLLACANVASLSLAKATTRTRELATRLALGAPRQRVFRQLMVESVMLAVLGGGLGLALSVGGGKLLQILGPATLPNLEEMGVDGTVVAFGFLVSLLTVPLFGIFPALKGTGFDLASSLRFGARGGTERRGRARSVLVVAQVALSMTLLIASGMLIRSFRALQHVDPGFPVESMMTAGIQIPDYKYPGEVELALAWDQVLDRLGAVPGVQDVAAAEWLPISPGGGRWMSIFRTDQPPAEGEPGTPAAHKTVSADYFRTLGVPLLAGRAFNRSDRFDTPPVMIISESLAGVLFPDQDPIGGEITLWGTSFEVIGLARDVSERGPGRDGRPPYFVAVNQVPQASLSLMVRTANLDPLEVVAGVREALREIDPDIALTGIQTMEARVSDTLAQPRFRMALVGAFALAGLLLAAFGLYGVLAFFVAQRRNEIGIRMAVGAGQSSVVGLVLRHGLALVGAGAVLGVLGGAVATVSLQSLLFGVSLADPVTLGGATAVLLLVAFSASGLPAWKAARVDPLESLRAE
jgi:predicted permease